MTPDTETKYFPAALLGCPISEKAEYFKNYIVGHPRLDTVLEQIWNGIMGAPDGTLYFVFGPTGVGKTTLREALERRLGEGRKKNQFLSLEVPPSTWMHYDWDKFYTEALKAARQVPQSNSGRRRDQFHDWLRTHKPRALFLDESQHFIVNGRVYRIQAQMDVLKSLANQLETHLVLFGTYELLACRNLNAQLARRSLDIPFERYRPTTQDMRDYNRVLLSFQRKLPVRRLPDLLPHIEYFFAVSVGCVGVLKTWLLKALQMAWNRNDGHLTIEIIREAAPSLAKSHSMAFEVIENEAKLHNSAESLERLYNILGMNFPSIEPDTSGRPPINPALLPGREKQTHTTEEKTPNEPTIEIKPRLSKRIPKAKPRQIPIGPAKDGSG